MYGSFTYDGHRFDNEDDMNRYIVESQDNAYCFPHNYGGVKIDNTEESYQLSASLIDDLPDVASGPRPLGQHRNTKNTTQHGANILDKNKTYAKRYWYDTPLESYSSCNTQHSFGLYIYYNSTYGEWMYAKTHHDLSISLTGHGSPSENVLSSLDLEEVDISTKLSKNRRYKHIKFRFVADDFTVETRLDTYQDQLKTKYIKQQNTGEEQMKTNVNYPGTGYKVVKVEYIDSTYTRYYNFKIDAELADKLPKAVEEFPAPTADKPGPLTPAKPKPTILVVESSNGLGLVRLIEVIEDTLANAEEVSKASAWVVDIVDTEEHDRRKDNAKRLQYIETKLAEKQENLKTIQMYELLAKYDPEAKKLLAEMQELTATQLPNESSEDK